MVSDDAREEDRVQSRSFGKLLSELGHYSKSNGKSIEGSKQESDNIYVLKSSLYDDATKKLK